MTMLSFGIPTSANAYDYNYQRQQEMHHQRWEGHHPDEANRAYPRYGYNGYDNYREYDNRPRWGHRNLPANGQGMINHRNPNLSGHAIRTAIIAIGPAAKWFDIAA